MSGLYKTKAKLRESEAEIRGIFDGAQEAFCVIDDASNILDFNKRFEMACFAFYEKSLIRGMNYLAIFPESEQNSIAKRIQNVCEGRGEDFERLAQNNGIDLWVRVNYKPISDKSGKISRIIISITDITTYKLALHELDESYSKLEFIFNYSTDALFIIDQKLEFIIDCNSTCLKLFEADQKSQIVGLRGLDLHKQTVNETVAESMNKNFWESKDELFEFEYKTFKGNTFWGNLSGKSIETPDGIINLVRLIDVSSKKAAEEKINQVERKFRLLADSSPAMLWISDQGGKMIFYNQSWLKFRGLSLMDEIDWGLKDGIHPDDYNHLINDIYNPAIENKQGYTAEYRLKRMDGNFRWILENTVPKFDFEGNFEGLFGSAIDIQELKEGQKKVEESEAKFKDLANSLPTMLWTSDVNGGISFYNSAWLNFTGRNLEQELGRGWIENVHPDDIVPFVNETYYAALHARKPYAAEFRLRRYDDEYRWVLESGVPKFDSNGEFEGLIGSTLDITDRKNAEINLKHQEKFNSRISELSPDFIYIYDLNLKQNIYNNRSLTELLGYGGDEYPQLNEHVFVELVHPHDHELVKYSEAYFFKFNKAVYVDLEFRMKAPGGGWRWINTRETIFSYDDKGNPAQLLGNGRDITEKKLTEQELIQTNNELKVINEELDGFVYRASHDLRAPLSSVLGLINLTKEDVKDEKATFYFDLIEKSIKKLSEVTSDLIDQARNASLEMSVGLISFKTIVTDIIDGIRFHENSAKIKFDINIEEEIPFGTDRLRVILLFNNLISNAVKYHDNSKSTMYLKISIITSHENALITVEDNGLGIEEQFQDKIFDMFFRVNKTVSGTGLGLYIVKGAIDKLKGSIRLVSKPKQGTTFFVELPNKA